ncbi:hypothetical protein [Aliidiomarina quisquiliarum]|uniref:hypothetical protein n=1 Tax=Aliidiomarina quisquiliarum TaxID=2938947 RepID=UPI00208EF246|nr:hypothetical protein [Aliidiomarina quisquiliarum]MCO4321410.1 hypothetical protein [Aliidiomarina quisquiliarum]
MKSIWNCIEEKAFGKWREYCKEIGELEACDALIKANRDKLVAFSQAGTERLNCNTPISSSSYS